jgi:hypothetical protein
MSEVSLYALIDRMSDAATLEREVPTATFLSWADRVKAEVAELGKERDQLAAMVLAARSYFGVNETSYAVKMLDSASEIASTVIATRDANTKSATRQATLKEVLMAYRTMRHEFLPWLRDHIALGGDNDE